MKMRHPAARFPETRSCRTAMVASATKAIPTARRTGVDLRFDVNNVFDRLPPTLTTLALPVGPGNDNTFPVTYDSLGRTFFIGATIKY